jgi:hypothetical protein
MATDEQRTQAKEHGWIPQEEFKGDPGKWADADVFLERAETFIPFLNKAKRNLETQLSQERAQREKLQQQLEDTKRSVQTLEQIRVADATADREELRADLKARIAVATKDGDGEAVAELTDQLAELLSTPAKPAAPAKSDPPPQAGTPQTTYTPEFISWRERNEWFGIDPDKSEYALYQASRIRRLEPDLKGTAFWDKVSSTVDVQFNPPPKHAKVDTSTLGGAGAGGGATNGKGYTDLSADAKAIVADEARFRVGPDKQYKTLAEWQNYYAKVFFSQSLKP